HLYIGVRAERDVYLEDHFTALADRHENLAVTVVLSEPDRPTGRRTGFLADAIAEGFETLDGCEAYLAGPPVMVESVTQKLKALGVRRQDCHADAFYTEAEKAKLEGA
ncbi:MAG: oxidoreductase, partial [Bauldia litoralis]